MVTGEHILFASVTVADSTVSPHIRELSGLTVQLEPVHVTPFQVTLLFPLPPETLRLYTASSPTQLSDTEVKLSDADNGLSGVTESLALAVQV